MTNKPPPVNPWALAAGVAAAGLLLLIVLFRSSPQQELPADQRAMAAALVTNLNNTGVLVRHDCGLGEAHVNRPLWVQFNADQRRNLTVGLATACDNDRAGYRIRILDNDSREELASFDGQRFIDGSGGR